MIKEVYRDLKGTTLLARENKIYFLASGVSFFALFSLCPFLIVTFIASRWVLRSVSAVSETPHQLSNVLKGVLPSLDPNLATEFLSLLRHNSATSILNLLVLIWCAFELFRSMNYAFEHLSVEGRIRGAFWQNFIAGFCFLIVVAISTFLLFVTTSDISSLKDYFQQYFAAWSVLSFKILVACLSLMLVVLGISIIYKVMPTESISWEFAFMGSLLFLMLFIIGRVGFSAYGEQYRALNQAVYGPFITFIMVSIWIYYLSFIFLFAAQYAIYLESEKKL